MTSVHECRICLEDDAKLSMINPCRCSGTQGWVHLTCLNRWREESVSAYKQCKVCQFTYLIYYDSDYWKALFFVLIVHITQSLAKLVYLWCLLFALNFFPLLDCSALKAFATVTLCSLGFLLSLSPFFTWFRWITSSLRLILFVLLSSLCILVRPLNIEWPIHINGRIFWPFASLLILYNTETTSLYLIKYLKGERPIRLHTNEHAGIITFPAENSAIKNLIFCHFFASFLIDWMNFLEKVDSYEKEMRHRHEKLACVITGEG